MTTSADAACRRESGERRDRLRSGLDPGAPRREEAESRAAGRSRTGRRPRRRRAAPRSRRAPHPACGCRRRSRPSAARTPRPRRSGPSSGAVTSLSRRTPPAGASRRPERSMRATRASSPPPSPTGRPSVVEQQHPERGQRPGPAVGRGRAAEADDERRRPGVEGGRDHLAEPAGGGAERVGRRHEREPGRLRQLDDGRAVGQLEPVPGRRASVGSGHVPAERSTAPGTADAIAARVPSPPSACGSSTMSSSGRTDRQPSRSPARHPRRRASP